MSDWNFRHVFEYWDQSTGAINRFAVPLGKLNSLERMAECVEIQRAVEQHAQALSDDHLLKMAVSLTDDLYKYVNDAIYAAQALYEYLDAFGRTFLKAVRERGYVVQYVVENQFADVDFLMLGPFDLFAKVFNAAGFVYICPQQLGWQLMQADGLEAAAYASEIGRYIAEARMLADRLARECQAEGRHYAFLDADYQEGSLNAALQGRGTPGALSLFRNDAPVPGSTLAMDFPSQKLGG